MSSKSEGDYVEVSGKSGKVDSVWHYFLKETSGASAKCKDPMCKKPILKTSGGSTKGCRDHLKRVHDIDLNNVQTLTLTHSGGDAASGKCQCKINIIHLNPSLTITFRAIL
jgi:hypothetical protein